MSYHLSEIGKEVRGTAEWRRHKAVDFPHHTDRNLDAAEELDYLAAEIEQLEGADIEQQIGEAGEALMPTKVSPRVVRSRAGPRVA